MKNTSERFREDLTKRQNKACEDLGHKEASLQHALRDVVVKDVIKRFP